MNSIAKLIAMHDSDYVLLPKATQLDIDATILLYLFKGCEVQVLNAALKDNLNWSGQSCIDFRKKLANSGYIQKNLKLYVYAVLTGVKRKAEDFAVSEDDAGFVTKLTRSRAATPLKLSKLCKEFDAKGFKARTLNGFDIGLNKACISLKKDAYCEKFVGKKFRFLTECGQKDEQSLIAEMFEFALRSAYRAYPEIEGLLHLVNIMKQGIHNRGINILKEETTDKRKRMVKNQDGTFSGTLLSLQFTDFEQTFAASSGATVSTCNALMCGLDGSSAEHERVSDVDRKRDLQKAVDRVIGTTCKDPASKKFIELLMGEHDEDFSQFLGVGSNLDASYKLSRSQYVEKAREFLGMPKPVAQSYFALWRTKLVDFQN